MGIDIGTQSVRCGVADEKGSFLALGEEKYPATYPKPGYAEQSPDDWISCLEKIILECRGKLGDEVFKKIAAISVGATSSTVVPVNNKGHPLSNAILWMDTRAVVQAARINKTGHELLRYCGGEVSVEWLVPKMMWLKDNEPELFKEAEHIVEAQDYINYYLTGNWAAAVCQATCKSNYVEDSGGFVPEFFDTIGFPEFFDKAVLKVLKQAEPVGQIKKELAGRLGFSEKTIVYQGGVDAHVNMLGLGVCKAGETGVVMGTSFVQLALVDSPSFESGIWGPYKDVVVPGKYCLEGGQVSAGSIIKWFFKEFGIQSENPFAMLGEEARKHPKGSENLLLLDFFQGNRTPYKDPNARGVLFGLTLSHTRAHIYRAILEGVAFGMRNILDRMEGGGRKPITVLRGCGGATNNGLWKKIIADITGKPIVLTANSGNAGILGGAIISAVGNGSFKTFDDACASMTEITTVVEPDMAEHDAYEPYFQRYLRLYQSTKGLL
jgi:FGGY-family pentulose kinase